MSCICGTSTVFFRILNHVLVAAVGNVDRIVCSVVVVVLASRVPHASSPPVGPLFSYPLWIRSLQLFFTLVLVKAAGDFSLFSSVRRALHDFLMALHELLRGELFARSRSSTCCAWLLGLTSTTLSPPPLRSRRCPAQVRSLRA